MLYPPETWKWYGAAAHLCVGRWCRFHMATLVGPWLVSTVGEYIPNSKTGGSERGELEYLEEHPFGEEIGYGRLFETMVFRAGEPCPVPECGCGMPTLASGQELAVRGYNTRGDANRGHAEMCLEWANVSSEEHQEEL